MVKPRKENDHDGCTLIIHGKLKSLYPGMEYYVYENQDGSIHGETLCATFDIAKTRAEYEGLKEDELEYKIYAGEMTIAR